MCILPKHLSQTEAKYPARTGFDQVEPQSTGLNPDRTIGPPTIKNRQRLVSKFRVVDDSFAAIDTLYGAGYSFNDV